jgi:molybdate transport system regulatory protein
MSRARGSGSSSMSRVVVERPRERPPPAVAWARSASSRLVPGHAAVVRYLGHWIPDLHVADPAAQLVASTAGHRIISPAFNACAVRESITDSIPAAELRPVDGANIFSPDAREARDVSQRDARKPSAEPLARRLRPRVKGWLTWDSAFVMGPRYVLLLEGIDETGSIRAGCERTGMSYRTCLNRLRQMERVLGAPMVRTSRGGAARGGASLTPLGRRLVRTYRGWRSELQTLSDQAFDAALAAALRD